ncbi:hypothetical protein VNO77_03473 [Canavalia gladiata]|uniref:Uncharacterized protein n=1 Tax=Canavalia gladiata TaxID=3824 RepID=A0AAN9R3X7_CANGL
MSIAILQASIRIGGELGGSSKKAISRELGNSLISWPSAKLEADSSRQKGIRLQYKPILSPSDSRKTPNAHLKSINPSSILDPNLSRLSVSDLNVCGKRPKSYCIADDVRFAYATVSFIVQWFGVRYPDLLG